jgi:hypothetical protein
MLEQALENMTIAINRLNETLTKMSINAPKVMLSNEHPALQKAAEAIDQIHKDEADAKAKEQDVVDAPKAKTTRKAKATKTVTEVDVDQVQPLHLVATYEEVQAALVAKVQSDRALKPKIKQILNDFGANTLPELKEANYNEVLTLIGAL